ncbi:MAG: hypothetical protein KDI24_12695 [Pseudomonadales bacterium]|nr:hypothetical protein [Pseudomonadales bacterium]MCP5171388.1 hypothetical protein [Pseudomonadales bacterium]
MDRAQFPLKALLWLILLCLCAAYSSYRIANDDAFDSNILGLLPTSVASQQQIEIQKHFQQAFDKSFVILIQGKTAEEGLLLAGNLKQQLQQSGILTLDALIPSYPDLLKATYSPYRFQLLNASSREWLERTSPKDIAQQSLEQLYSLVPAYRPYNFTDDPFNLGGLWVTGILNTGVAFALTEIPSIVENGNNWYLIKGTISGSPFDMDMQQSITRTISTFRQQQPTPDYQILLSGLVFHASEGAITARKEISTVGLGSLFGICLLVALVFSSWRSTAAILFTLISSSLIALTVSLLLYPKVHLVTLAFGSTLLGLAADYCFHFLVKYRSTKNARKTGYLLRKGLLFSAGSSISAYLVQLFSPFPGLQQFAIFLASGLAAACCSVFLLSAVFQDKSTQGFAYYSSIYKRKIEPFYQKLSAKRAVIPVLLTFLLIAPIYLILQEKNDDLRLLNSSSQSLIRSEQKVQQLLNVADGQRYFVITGDSSDLVLENTEKLNAKINRMLPGTMTAMFSASSLIPSGQRQHADYKLVIEKLYSDQGALPLLCQKLEIDCSSFRTPAYPGQLKIENLPADIIQQWPILSLLKEEYGVMLIPSTVRFSKEQIHQLIESTEITYSDRVAELSGVLQDFRIQVSTLLICFGVLLAIVSWVLFKHSGVTIVLPLVISILSALIVASLEGITLFHILALLLVAGIAIDTAAFYLHPGLDSDTWLASTLSCLTSLLAFGLLTFSEIPLLHQFGLVVFTGLLSAWLITPLIIFITNHYRQAAHDDN